MFAYWPASAYYYRGFVVKATDSQVYVHYDDGDNRWFDKNDPRPDVVLDEIPQKRYLLGQYVLAAIEVEDRYATGQIFEVGDRDDPKPWAKHSYYVKVNGANGYWEQFYQIRSLPKK